MRKQLDRLGLCFSWDRVSQVLPGALSREARLGEPLPPVSVGRRKRKWRTSGEKA
jgi:hypothetical protein